MKLTKLYLLLPLLALSCTLNQSSNESRILPPQELYGQLFYDVQERSDLFPDSKTFVDVVPKRSVADILNDYEELENKGDQEVLMTFLQQNFLIPGYEEAFETVQTTDATEHIQNLWDVLSRDADVRRSGTLIPLKNAYIVPGGRFREVYYWDSYFTMLGLQVDGRVELIDNIISNFSYLIDSMGFIPNGNRTYYNSRSQPPFYALMVDLHVTRNGTRSLQDYLPYLMKEYDFWMAGAGELTAANPAIRRVVRLDEGKVLNRYWDDSDTPRPESYREDLETVHEALEKNPDRNEGASYRHLRAAAESGWDFSSRWFEIGEDGEFDLSSIHTTDIIPVDLNSLLYFVERLVARAYEENEQLELADRWMDRANRRKSLIIEYCWNAQAGFFMDYDFRKQAHTPVKSLAGVYPLFFNIASKEQASRVAERITSEFLQPGGVVTTLNDSGQQWDYPNGWAPLQWMTIQGLWNYDNVQLADEITRRWLTLNDKVFQNTQKMTEKYNVVDLSLEGGGGEYPNQDGFGWTNGVYRRLIAEQMEGVVAEEEQAVAQ